MSEICQSVVCEKQQAGCEQRFVYLEKLFNGRFDAIDRAMSVADEEIKRRMHESNNLRQQMDRQSESFVDITYYRSEHAAIQKSIDELKSYRDTQVGKAATNNLLSAIALLLSFIMTVLHFFPAAAK